MAKKFYLGQFLTMQLIYTIILFNLISVAYSAQYEINDPQSIITDTAHFNEIISLGISFFEHNVAPINGQIKIEIGPGGCFSNGFDFKLNQIRFCENINTIFAGTQSDDVIRHELFHAMICNSFGQLCDLDMLSDVNTKMIHEAFADYFSYTFSNQLCFGQNYYKNANCIRDNGNSFCYNLVSTEYDKSNAITNLLIREKFSWNMFNHLSNKGDFNLITVLNLLKNQNDPCFDKNGIDYDILVSNGVESKFQKYWLHPNSEIEFELKFNEVAKQNYPYLTIEWSNQSQLFDIYESSTQYKFKIQAKNQSGFEKNEIIFRNEGVIIGKRHFYFGVNNP
jgi:hypothetical protein